MECPICLIEFKMFKILQCGHYYCKQCIGDLKGPSSSGKKSENVAGHSIMTNGHCAGDHPDINSSMVEKDRSSNSIACGSENAGTTSDGPQSLDGFPCPQCRQITPFNYPLKTRVVGNLMCRQCDTVKSTEDFRWCFDCSQSLCNTCFMDRHVHTNQDGAIALHNGSKWDQGYPQAAYCVRRLMKDVDQSVELIQKNQEYLKSYLDGLKEYVCHEIDQKTKQASYSHLQKIAAICEAYSLNKNDIVKMFGTAMVVSPDMSNKNYDTVLDEILRLAEITEEEDGNKSAGARDQEGKMIKLNCMPYKQMSNLLLSKKQPELQAANASDIQVNSGGYPILQEAITAISVEQKPSLKHHPLMGGVLNKTIALAVQALQKPSDICVLNDQYNSNNDIVLITDFDNGLFAMKADGDMSTVVPIPLKHQKFMHFSRIALMPENSCGKLKTDLFSSLVAVNVQHGGNDWHFVVVGVTRATGNGNGQSFDLVTVSKSIHWSLPSKENACLGSSKEWTYALTTKALFRCNWPMDMQWKEVYGGIHSGHQQFGRLGPIREVDKSDQKQNDRLVEIFLVNEVWKCVEILRFNEQHQGKIASLRRVELSALMTVDSSDFLTCKQPFLVPSSSNVADGRNLPHTAILVADKKSAFLYVWNNNECEKDSAAAAAAEKVHEFGMKYPQKIVYARSSVWFIFQHKENSNLRTIEFVNV